MYCRKCGKELSEEELFCSSCGTKQHENKRGLVDFDNKKGLYAFYISVITSPLLFIIRMLGQTSEHVEAGVNGAWRSHDTSVVPGNIRAIMILILIASTVLNISLRKNADSIEENKKRITKLMLIVNVFFGIVITFTEF